VKLQGDYFYADIYDMKKKTLFLFVLLVTVFIPYQLQAQEAEIFRQEGIASWYGMEFEGRPTASGEIFYSSQLTAAHPTLPFGTMLVATNLHNNRRVTVRVNDRGPFVPARIIDVSRAAAEHLDMIATGTAPVIVESIDQIATPQIITFTDNTPSPVVVISQPIVNQASFQVRLIPDINIIPNRVYRLQVGSYRVARNAVNAFERLKNSGLDPAYERFMDRNNVEFFRVVLSGIRGTEIQSTTEKIGNAGFREAFIREEN
jgi:rare lipoprotein A